MITMNLNMISYLLSFSILIGLVVAEFDSNGQVILRKFGKDVSIKFHTTDMRAKVKHRRFNDYNKRDVLCNTVTWNSNNCRIERNADENVIEIIIFNSSLKDTGIYMLECFNCDHPIQTRNLTLFDSLESDVKIYKKITQLGSIRFIPSFPQLVRIVAMVEGQPICYTITLENKTSQDSTADATGRYYTMYCSPITEISKTLKNGTTVTFLLQTENETVLIDVQNITISEQNDGSPDHDASNQQIYLLFLLLIPAIIFIIYFFVQKVTKRNHSPGNGQCGDDGEGNETGLQMLHNADGVGSSADVIYMKKKEDDNMSDRERWLRKVKNKEMEFTNMQEQFKPITTIYEEGPKRDVRTFPKGVGGNKNLGPHKKISTGNIQDRGDDNIFEKSQCTFTIV